jgi:hypothetical protein
MSNQKTGEVSWSEAVFDSSAKKSGKDTFLRLANGSNIVRLLTLPYQYYQHKHIVEGGKKYGYRVNCSASHGSCPLCEQGNKAKRRWFLGVIDRKTNAYKVLDIGYSVFKSISTFARDEDWGDPSQYDFDIVVDVNGGATGYYTVCPKPKRPLSAADLIIREENDVSELERRTAPPTPDRVKERLVAIEAEIAAGVSESETTSETSQDDENEETSDGAAFFKDYDQTKSGNSSAKSKVAPF